MNEVILHTENLTKKYGPTIAVLDINFSLKRGEIHAIVGANGAGKSTFVKLLFGDIAPSSGKIYVKGKEQTIHSPKQALKECMSMVPQDFGLVESMSISENLALAGQQSSKRFFYNSKAVDAKAKKIIS